MFGVNVLNPIGEQEPDLPSIKIDCSPFDIAIPKYATADKMSFFVGCIDGSIRSYTARPIEEWWSPEQYDEEGIEVYEDGDEDAEEEDSVEDDVAEDAFALNFNIKHSLLSIRGIELLPNDHKKLVSVTRDGSIGLIDTEIGKLVVNAESIHTCGFETMKMYSDNLLIAGDEEGSVMGYDLRIPSSKQQSVMKAKPQHKGGATTSNKKNNSKHDKNNNTPPTTTTTSPNTSKIDSDIELLKKEFSRAWIESDHGDAVTDICFNNRKQLAVFTSADGHLSAYDIRTGKFHDISEKNPDELMSCCMLKDDTMILTGSDTGPISIYDAGNMEDFKDRYLCQEASLDHLISLDDDTILSAGEDGIVRIITINPSHVLGVVAVHKDAISAIDVLRGRIEPDDFLWSNDIVGVASLDNVVRFWAIQDMQVLRKTRLTKTGKVIDYSKRKATYEDNSDDDDDDEIVDFKEMLREAEEEEMIKFFEKQRDRVVADDDGGGDNADGDADANKDDSDDFDFDMHADDWDDDDSDDDSDDGDDDDSDMMDSIDDDKDEIDDSMDSDLADLLGGDDDGDDDIDHISDKKDMNKLTAPSGEDIDSDDLSEGFELFDLSDSDEDDDEDDDADSDADSNKDSSKKHTTDKDDKPLPTTTATTATTATKKDPSNTTSKSTTDKNKNNNNKNNKNNTTSKKRSRNDPSDDDDDDDDDDSGVPDSDSDSFFDSDSDSDDAPKGKKSAKGKKGASKQQQKNQPKKANTKTKPKPAKKPRKTPYIKSAADFDPEDFRKSHNHKLAGAKSTGYFQERKAKQRATQANPNPNIPQLPDITHKLPRVRKVKHGTSNFFNGL